MKEPEEDLAKPENDESSSTKCNEDLEIKDSVDKSDTLLETHPPLLRENNKDSSTLSKCETSSSVIPEPPSSPSLSSLPDEDDEFTPSLGLEDDYWVIFMIIGLC